MVMRMVPPRKSRVARVIALTGAVFGGTLNCAVAKLCDAVAKLCEKSYLKWL